MQELLRDIVSRDVAARHRLRETRHVMNLVLFLFARTGQAFSYQRLTRNLAVQSCLELSEANRKREVRGLVEAMRFRGERRALVVTLDQRDKFAEQGHEIEVVPAWEWLG